MSGHTRSVVALAEHRERGFVFSAGYDNSVRVWSRDSFACLAVVRGFASAVFCLSVVGDDLFCGGHDTNMYRLSLAAVADAVAYVPATIWPRHDEGFAHDAAEIWFRYDEGCAYDAADIWFHSDEVLSDLPAPIWLPPHTSVASTPLPTHIFPPSL